MIDTTVKTSLNMGRATICNCTELQSRRKLFAIFMAIISLHLKKITSQANYL
jgi:hypothetical protein